MGALPESLFVSSSPPLTPLDIPLLWPYVKSLPEYHWPVPHAMIAKALGGCGIHNAMVHIRALREDFEGEDKGWGEGWNNWTSLQSYYDILEGKGETHTSNELFGLLKAEKSYIGDEIGRLFIESCR